ncbi:hypothetical protein J5N97_011262 [Dioscorea zingiberensis]|uniref:Protein TPX2 n=1 Tax=Dioscorea zingiberensis TaxID=325984 RepID=A0A9D5D2D7_9LILI|nr:hypothetical protein J5N97_011262 [Dioscorea zingiberensis]
MATNVEGVGSSITAFQMDEAYEFCAPRFFDFMNEETKEEVRRSELWFETSLSYAPSPFMPKIKMARSFQIDSIGDFGNLEKTQKGSEAAITGNQGEDLTSAAPNRTSSEQVSENKNCKDKNLLNEETRSVLAGSSSLSEGMNNLNKETSAFVFPAIPLSNSAVVQASEACTPRVGRGSVKGVATTNCSQTATDAHTPKAQRISVKGAPPNSSRNQTALKIANQIKQKSTVKHKSQSPAIPSMKSAKQKNATRCPGSVTEKNSMATDIAQENQAIKRQKLDGGKSRQILNVKNRVLPHKSKLGQAIGSGMDVFSSAAKGHHEERHNSFLQKETTPFISAAEMVQKFQSKTRDIELSQSRSFSHVDTASVIQRRPKLTLTRPKEPELETAHRVRAVRIKSSAELEEEMLAKIPKFKARPVNKKILEAPTLAALPRSAPQPPEFQEFHLKTMERANQHTETSSVVSSTMDTSSQDQGKHLKLTEPRPPLLETSLRARPPRVKSSQELEVEELQKIPKFKARPLNRKIFESKGDLGLPCNQKRQVTTPQEFHFATDERIGPPTTATVADLFDKLSLHSDSSYRDQQVPRITIPNPFHLHTEERGLEKEKQFTLHVLQKQLEEERARIPKANPYPYTTDYPVMPPKPEPKQCTKPEAFQLESLVRHEEEMHRKLEEKERMEKEEAQRRLFRAQPVLKEDPLPLPEKARKPLTDVQEFMLHADQRAAQRSEFDKKIKEKEMMYKRIREEYETTKQIEDEKAVKQMRRTMVPHARPLPKFHNPFQPQKSIKETTRPKSPNLHVIRREERCHASHLR